MSDTTKKRIIIHPAKSKQTVESHDFIPATDLLLHDAKCIISGELSRYRAKVQKGLSLDLKEARVIQGYLDALVRLQKEERDASRAQDLSNLSDEELLALAQSVFGGSRAASALSERESSKSLESRESDED